MYLFFHSFIYCICLSCNEWTIGGLLDSTKQVSWQSCIADRPSFEAATYVHVGPFSEGNMLSPCHFYCLTRPRSSQTPGQLLSKGLKIVGIPIRNTYIPNWSKLCKCIGCTIPGFGSIGIYRPVVSIYPNCISQYIPVAGSSMQGWPPQPFHLLVERAQRGSIGPCRVPGPARRHGISWRHGVSYSGDTVHDLSLKFTMFYHQETPLLGCLPLRQSKLSCWNSKVPQSMFSMCREGPPYVAWDFSSIIVNILKSKHRWTNFEVWGVELSLDQPLTCWTVVAEF